MSVKRTVAQLLLDNPKVWIETYTLQDEAASDSATRRLRELRSEGWSIKHRFVDGTHAYMLTRVPAKKVVAQYV